MTIDIYGHIAALEHGPRDQVAVVIQIESSRMFGERGDAPRAGGEREAAQARRRRDPAGWWPRAPRRVQHAGALSRRESFPLISKYN